MIKKTTLAITLFLQGPVIVGTSSAGHFGLDKAFEKDFQNRPCIPKSLVKGRLREALEQLSGYGPALGINPADIVSWFGTGTQPKQSNKPMPGKLVFSDFICTQPYIDDARKIDEARTRITIDKQRGAVKKGGYFTTQTLFASGCRVSFEGEISFFGDPEECLKIEKSLLMGFSWIPALGGDKNSGSGLVLDVQTSSSSIPMPKPAAALKTADASFVYDLTLDPKEPFCTGTRVEKNFFRASGIITGGAIKGAMANTLNQILGRKLGSNITKDLPAPWTELGANFHRIGITHAFPAKKGNPRPLQFPLTTVRAPSKDKGNRNNKTFDIALCHGPGLINDSAPAFYIDWKDDDFNDVQNNIFPWPNHLEKTFRVRTAIDAKTRRAKDEALFAYEMVSPKGHQWKSRINFTQVDPSRVNRVKEQFRALVDYGVQYLGKTKVQARARMARCDEDTCPKPVREGYWIVTLQTPALMIQPVGQNGDKTTCPEDKPPGIEYLNYSRVDPDHLQKAYAAFWSNISRQKLELVRFFASQTLMGGYLNHRFQNGKPYYPYFVTMDRSVFVLRSAPEDHIASDLLSGWMKNGLPLPVYLRENTWRDCPFVPENGYGEIMVNMDTHVNNKPGKSEFKLLQEIP